MYIDGSLCSHITQMKNKVLEDRVQTLTNQSYMTVPTYILLSLSYRLGLDVE